MQSTIVLDAGSGSVKAGCSSANAPAFLPSLAGRAKYKPLFQSAPAPAVVAVGNEIADRRGLLHLSYPIQHGTIVDWDAWQLLLQQLEQRLDTPFADRDVFWVEHPFSSRPQRARVAQILFEEKQAAGMCVGVAPLLSLYATGQTTGIVLDVGEGVSSVAAAVQGYAVTEMMQREDFGGGAVTQYLQRLLREYGSYNTCSGNSGGGTNATVVRSFNPSRCGAERELVRAIKEQRCEVSPHPVPTSTGAAVVTGVAGGGGGSIVRGAGDADELFSSNNNSRNDAAFLNLAHAVATAAPKRHRLPDGTELTLGHELLQAPEVLFSPALIGKEHVGLAGIVADAVRVADVELRAELCQHVYLTGGTTLLQGFGQRFLTELLQLTPRDCKVRVAAPAERSHTAWLGAAFLARLSTFQQQMVVSRAAFMEEGERALHARLVG
ncbi:putative actin [Trypanosoma grayi]|uniref:putative actin n=1 Tax=Trypanosoma grayi TaxID=71804 RepID=UPI0004F472E8|nr:putative actin [Trypanosoma grayi]KEG09935.1 putative actin [Trypanosoma grayi]